MELVTEGLLVPGMVTVFIRGRGGGSLEGRGSFCAAAFNTAATNAKWRQIKKWNVKIVEYCLINRRRVVHGKTMSHVGLLKNLLVFLTSHSTKRFPEHLCHRKMWHTMFCWIYSHVNFARNMNLLGLKDHEWNLKLYSRLYMFAGRLITPSPLVCKWCTLQYKMSLFSSKITWQKTKSKFIFQYALANKFITKFTPSSK